MPYKNRLEELLNTVLYYASLVQDEEEIDGLEVLGTIIAEIGEIEENDKSVYNTAYRAGFRAATMWHLGGKCSVCGEDNWELLEIEHIDGEGLVSEEGRGPADWKDLDVMTLLCKSCHEDTWNYKLPSSRPRN